MESPRLASTTSGLNATASIVTVCFAGLTAAPWPTLIESRATAATSETTTTIRVCGFIDVLLLQRRLNVLGVFEMRNERRAHLHEERLQFGVLRAWNQRLVHGIEHGLVIGHLVIDVRLVELCALQAPEVFQIVVTAGLQTLARRIVLRRHLELGHEIDRLLVAAGVIRHHPLTEFLDFRI